MLNRARLISSVSTSRLAPHTDTHTYARTDTHARTHIRMPPELPLASQPPTLAHLRPTCRPIYAGNALLTVRCSQPGLRVCTVRPTSFTPAPLISGSGSSSTPAPQEAVAQEHINAAVAVVDSGVSQWVEEVRGC